MNACVIFLTAIVQMCRHLSSTNLQATQAKHNSEAHIKAALQACSTKCLGCQRGGRRDEHLALYAGLLAWLEAEDGLAALQMLSALEEAEYVYESGRHENQFFCAFCNTLVYLGGYEVMLPMFASQSLSQ